MRPETCPAVLALADGTVYRGHSIGAAGIAIGELVFNTAMSGYQEILTDPSYAGQLVTLTYPHIGNTGVNVDDAESGRIHAAGLIIRDLSARVSNYRAQGGLSEYLRDADRPGIAGIDTRALVRRLREHGAQGGCLLASDSADAVIDVDEAIARARGFSGLAGRDLAKVVSTDAAYPWHEGTWVLGQGFRAQPAKRFKVVALDFGIKRNILRMLADRGCDLIVLPAQAGFAEVSSHAPDAVFLSNGPGDPEPCDYAIALARAVMAERLPLFGICLGHQIMALASGARTIKMKNGHHGANHPVRDHDTGKVYITSQNHGFAVDGDSLPANLRLTHTSLFDGTVQGLASTDRPAFSFQGHPEASPGPHDIGDLFDRFITLIETRRPWAG